MSRVGRAIQYRRLRSPKDHGGRLIDPPLRKVPERVASNLASARQRQFELQGRSFAELSEAARSHVLDAAIRYTSRYRDVADSLHGSGAPIVMTGHQPELYHAGVWYKNFVLDSVTREQQAVGINLLIDNDTIRQPAIRVPTGSVDAPLVESVAFDQMHDELPFEERCLIDSDLFGSFSQRVRAKLFRAIERPLIEQVWPAAVAAARSTQNLGSGLSQARHQLEADWGLKTLELPWSQVCDGGPFRWFATTLLARLPQFHQIHNESLLEYRRVNRVRSQAHPVPSLASDGEWFEAPFWLWSSADPKRRRLFARSVRDGVEITDRQSTRHYLPLTPDGSCEVAVEQLGQLSDQGVKLRSRALLTTMFARLFLCDLFIHGIGGAKYDQLTDAIIQRFFGFSAPDFLTVTATAKLPIEHHAVSDAEILAIQLQLRELRFNPQRYLGSSPEAASLVQAKQQLIAMPSQSGQGIERHRRIAQINDAMQPMVEQERIKLLHQRTNLIEQARVGKLLGSREFSFCLFPETTLQPLLLDI
ncbi:MAG: hypothetical protein O3C40_22615 [Planctomycetota bacterium]|nr:hypothetical protein [Planctomycetota bacterium]